MAVVKNTFSATLDSITYSNYTLTGLTSETSTLNVSNVSPEITKHFSQSLYQTLLDAGYTDAVLNEDEHSITVLGFKFFILCNKYSSSNNPCHPITFVYGINNWFSYYIYNYSSQNYYGINKYNTNEKELEYHITVRGDKNCVSIMYSSPFYPNNENPLIFIAKSKNLITSEDAFLFSCTMYASSNSLFGDYFYYRNKSDLYKYYEEINTRFNYIINTSSTQYGLSTSSKYIISPVLGYYKSYLVKSMIVSDQALFAGRKYYKIGPDIYYCYGFSYASNSPTSCYGYPILFKVSD